MASAKPKSLKVRPFQSVDLCFDSDGIIGEQNFALAKLGATVQAFDLNLFYKGFNSPQPTTGGASFDTGGSDGGATLSSSCDSSRERLRKRKRVSSDGSSIDSL